MVSASDGESGSVILESKELDSDIGDWTLYGAAGLGLRDLILNAAIILASAASSTVSW